MSAPYVRSLRALDVDRRFRSPVSAITAIALLVGWIGWLAFARLGVWERSEHARLEVAGEARAVEAGVSGEVLASRLELGRIVRAGDTLLELDAGAQSLEWAARQEDLTRARARVSALERRRRDEEGAALERLQLETAREAESGAKAGQAESSFYAAERDAERKEQLNLDGVVSESELESARTEQTSQARAFEAARWRATQAGHRVEAARRDLDVLAGKFEDEQRTLEAEIARTEANLERLDRERERRTILAPIDGRIGESEPFRSGRFVEAGTRICTIVPSGRPRVVAWFEPRAAGGIRLDQPAILKLQGPRSGNRERWRARVAGVASELRNGRIRVELDLVDASASESLVHGMTADVEIEVATIRPLQWLGLTASRVPGD